MSSYFSLPPRVVFGSESRVVDPWPLRSACWRARYRTANFCWKQSRVSVCFPAHGEHLSPCHKHDTCYNSSLDVVMAAPPVTFWLLESFISDRLTFSSICWFSVRQSLNDSVIICSEVIRVRQKDFSVMPVRLARCCAPVGNKWLFSVHVFLLLLLSGL